MPLFISSKRSQEWLQHSVHFGDIGRILEPLLITMLNPSSRRISVHYTFLWKSNNQHTARPQSITSEKQQSKPNWSNVENCKQSISTDSQSDQMDSGLNTLLIRPILKYSETLWLIRETRLAGFCIFAKMCFISFVI